MKGMEIDTEKMENRGNGWWEDGGKEINGGRQLEEKWSNRPRGK